MERIICIASRLLIIVRTNNNLEMAIWLQFETNGADITTITAKKITTLKWYDFNHGIYVTDVTRVRPPEQLFIDVHFWQRFSHHHFCIERRRIINWLLWEFCNSGATVIDARCFSRKDGYAAEGKLFTHYGRNAEPWDQRVTARVPNFLILASDDAGDGVMCWLENCNTSPADKGEVIRVGAVFLLTKAKRRQLSAWPNAFQQLAKTVATARNTTLMILRTPLSSARNGVLAIASCHAS